MLTATAAPAFAASQCNNFVTPSASAWTVTNQNISAAGGTDGFQTGGYKVVQDPGSTGAASVTVTANQRVRFLAGTTYTFSFNFYRYVDNPRSVVFTLVVNGTTVTNSTVTTVGTATGNGSVSNATYQATTSGCYPVALSFVYGNESSTTGDDITITNLARSPA
ncbi:hypothetical protein [Marmoricola endophyticus]|uniref:hypothetical protein n=1 Tax=Marmoricola endophyticus TaxID=2040280 RepID=UPI0016682038|nr:hypothetical protein [Marmoricola endophyticus]